MSKRGFVLLEHLLPAEPPEQGPTNSSPQFFQRIRDVVEQPTRSNPCAQSINFLMLSRLLRRNGSLVGIIPNVFARSCGFACSPNPFPWRVVGRRSIATESDPSGSSSKRDLGPESVVQKTAFGSTTKQYTFELNKAYGDIERNLMKRINESNTQRFRIILLSFVLGVLWIFAVFGERMRKMLAKETAGLAKETLENESLKIQTQELAQSVVQTVLNDKDVTAHAAAFLHAAASAPETQEALLQLTIHLIRHPDSIRELNLLARKLLEVLLAEKVTITRLT